MVTGLRQSELLNVRWSDIKEHKGETFLEIRTGHKIHRIFLTRVARTVLEQVRPGSPSSNVLVFSGESVNANNISQAFRRYDRPVSRAILQCISDYLKKDGMALLSDLLNDLEGQVTHDDVYFLIARNQIHIDWEVAPLVKTENVHVFADYDTMLAFHASRSNVPIDSGVLELRPGEKVS